MVEPLRYYLDEDVDYGPVVADALRRRGIDVLTTGEAGRASQGVSDPDQLAFATAHGRVMVTQDVRFSPPLPHAGLVVIQRAVALGDYIDFLEAVARIYKAEEMRPRPTIRPPWSVL